MEKEQKLSAKFKFLTFTWIISLAMILWTIMQVSSHWVYKAEIVDNWIPNQITMRGWRASAGSEGRMPVYVDNANSRGVVMTNLKALWYTCFYVQWGLEWWVYIWNGSGQNTEYRTLCL